MKYQKEQFDVLTPQRKLEVISEEINLATHNGTTKDDLLMLLEYCYNRCVNIDGNTSDGYHTFDELYEYRKVFNALLFNQWVKDGLYQVHKSERHSDGELCFGGGWFIVVAQLPTGQISNHYKMEDYDLFRCAEREFANEYDGHTPVDVLDRMYGMLRDTEEAE